MFSTGLGPSFKDWEGMLFLIWNLVQLHGRAKWSGVRRGKLGLCQTYLKSEKEGRRGDSHPAGCFACHSEESEAKFSPSRRQKTLELWLTLELPGQMRCSSCVLLIPSLSLLTLMVYSNRHKETFKREMYCSVSVPQARE